MRLAALVATIIGPMLIALAGCTATGFQPEGKALGRVDTPDQAAADALVLSILGRPIMILNVRGGIAREIYTGAYPSWVAGDPQMEQAHERFLAKLERSAWRVRVTGGALEPDGCCVWEELIIDQETGSLLFSVQATGIPEGG